MSNLFNFPSEYRNRIERLIKFVSNRPGYSFDVDLQDVDGELTLAFSEREISNFPFWKKGYFTIDGQGFMPGYHQPNQPWNGWQMPAFDKDILVNWYNAQTPEGPRAYYDKRKNAVYLPEPDNEPDHHWALHLDVPTREGYISLYAPDGWRFDLIAPEGGRCALCEHSIEVHIHGEELGKCATHFCGCDHFVVDRENT